LDKVESADDISWRYSKAFDYDNHIPMTALMVACELINLPAVRLLLAKGAKPKAFCPRYDSCTCSLLHYSSHDCFEICNEVLSNNTSNFNHSRDIRAILEHLHQVSTLNSTLNPPSASVQSSLEIVNETESAMSLFDCLKRRSLDLTKKLLSENTDTNVTNDHGETPFDTAIINSIHIENDLESDQFLITVDPFYSQVALLLLDKMPPDSTSPVWKAAHRGEFQLARDLLLEGPDEDSAYDKYFDCRIHSIFTGFKKWEDAVVRDHWRKGVDPDLDPTMHVNYGTEFASILSIREAFGDILPKRVYHQLYEEAHGDESRPYFDVVFVLLNRDLHIRIELEENDFNGILRHSVALETGHPFLQKYGSAVYSGLGTGTNKATRRTFDSELESFKDALDRQFGQEKLQIYTRELEDGNGSDEALEKAEKYDPEYDEDSAFGTDYSDDDMEDGSEGEEIDTVATSTLQPDDECIDMECYSVDDDDSTEYEDEAYEFDSDGRVIIEDVQLRDTLTGSEEDEHENDVEDDDDDDDDDDDSDDCYESNNDS